MWEAVACGDLLVAPKGGRLDDLAKTGVKHTPDDIVKSLDEARAAMAELSKCG